MEICNYKINVGDFVKVRYTRGSRFKGGILTGKVTKLWNTEGDDYPIAPVKQGQINNGWCFHDHDVIIEHIKKNNQRRQR